MVVYWDLAALVNGAADYLLLLSAARLAGRTVPRLRLLGAAAFGAAYAVLRLVLPCSPWLNAAAFIGMALLAFRGTGRALKLGLLTLLLSCALGGGVLLLGQCCGTLERVARGVIFAQLPWGVLLGAMGVTYLLALDRFRGGARHDGGELPRVRLTRGGKTVTLRLLHDSGNLLTDPLTGESVPVIGQSALRAAAAGARGGLHNAFLHDGGRQRDAAGVLLRQRSRERQGLGTAADRRFAGHLRRQRLSGRMAHGGTGGST
ncbi:MAG: sigma-E processing peptidase SpoIIGA [Oscillospiraceae bacterium]